jgi:hypothetical protein
VKQPELGKGKSYNDYGQGFYCTESLDPAKEWACPTRKDGFANQYTLDTGGLSLLHLSDGGHHILNRLALLLKNRTFDLYAALALQAREYVIQNFMPYLSGKDYIIGCRADDSYFSFAEDFVSGILSLRDLSETMRLGAIGESYLNKAQKTLAAMMDYAVSDLDCEPDEFFMLFLQSGLVDEFGRGNPKYVAGKSGAELAREVVLLTTGRSVDVTPTPRFDRSPVYWAAWALAYYQWYSGHGFEEIHRALSFSEMLNMYPTLHEADINKFVSVADEVLTESKKRETNLVRLRKARGFSQKELAEASGVALRMIQLYEQTSPAFLLLIFNETYIIRA